MNSTQRVSVTAAVLALSIAIILAMTTYWHPSQVDHPSPPCDRVTELKHYRFVEPALNLRQVEDRIRGDRYIHDSARDKILKDWRFFAGQIRDGDRILEMRTPNLGGYAVIRGNCLVDQFRTWQS